MSKYRFAWLCVIAIVAHLSVSAAVELAAQASPVSIGSVKRIYVDKMDNDLDQY